MKKFVFLFAVLTLALGGLCAVAHAGGGGGKGAAPSAPPPLPPTPIPDTTPQEAVSAAVRDDERRKLRQRQGVGGTVLAPLGREDQMGGGNTLLGKIG